MTYREKMAIEHPEDITDSSLGGVWGCPPDMSVYACVRSGGNSEANCRFCWDREIPGTEPITPVKEEKENTVMQTTKKTKAELLDEIAALKKQVEDLERYKKYEEMANELYAIHQSFVNAGFDEDMASKLLLTTLKLAPAMR